MITSRTARTSVVRGRPPNFADGMCGPTNTHCASVRSEGWHGLRMTISARLCADFMLPANTTTQNFRQSLSLLAHRALVPETHKISIRIGKLDAIAPIGFAWTVGELDAPRGPLGEGCVDVGHLEPHGASVRTDRGRGLMQKDRKAFAVLKRDRAPFRNLEFDLADKRA